MRHIVSAALLPRIVGVPTRCGTTAAGAGEDDVVTPWNVTATGPGGIDYDRVLTRFKSEPMDELMLQRLEHVYQARKFTGGRDASRSGDSSSSSSNAGKQQLQLHHFFRRGIVFSHRDFGAALESVRCALTTGTCRAYLYTGRGPSARSMHIGHVIPFLLTRYLQEALDLPLVIQITDDEKFFFRDVPLGACNGAVSDLVVENMKDIIAFGFDPRRTFIFCNTAYMGYMYPTVARVQRMLTLSAVKNTFGLHDSDNIGKVAFPAIQAAPCFCSAFPRVLQQPEQEPPLQCIVPCAIDQDPFFLLTRAAASRMKCRAPALLHAKFLPALKGSKFKMSSSAEENGVITLHDTELQVRKKMRKAFSGGGGTLQDMQKKGVDLQVDVAYQFIRFFCPDDNFLAEVEENYSTGNMNSAQVKDLASNVIVQHVLSEWQARRANITDAEVEHFSSIRNILL